jgi:hypothetical protein
LNSEVLRTLVADSVLRGSKFQTTNYADMMASERQVAEFLDELGFTWVFQSPIFLYDERKRPRVWSPDFYIPKLGTYIEVCGSKEFNYEYRKKIYSDNNIPVIYLHFYKQQKHWQKFIVLKIKEVEEQRHIEAMKQIENMPAEIVDYLEYGC